MANIFQIVSYIYTQQQSGWINELDNAEIQPFLINKFLMMNEEVHGYVKYLDQYTFCLEPKQWLHLAWSVIPKRSKSPFCKYIKKKESFVEHEEILNIIHSVLEISGNDCVSDRYFIQHIMPNITKWLKLFGMDKKVWKKYNADYKEMKVSNVVKEEKKQGLDVWF